MASKPGRSGTHGNRKGKRKATEAPSPASSQSSNGAYAKAFRAQREEAKRIKIKEEPIGPERRQPRYGSVAEAAETMRIENADDDTTFEQTEHGLLTPSSTPHTLEDRTPPDSSWQFDISADSLYVLRKCDIETNPKKVERVAGQLVDDAFGLPIRSEKDVPGIAYLDWVVEKLDKSGVVRERKDRVQHELMKTWRSQMAEYIAKKTSSSDEALNAIHTFVNALDDQAKPNPAFLRISDAPPIKGDDNDPEADGYTEPTTPKPIPFEFSHKIVLEDVHSAGRNADPVISETLCEVANQNATGAELTRASLRPSNEPPIEPVFIPSPALGNLDFSCRVMFFVKAPDMPCMNISKQRMIRACSLAEFGTGPARPQVERFSDHFWMATFQHARDADNVRGKAIVLNGRSIVAEYVHPKPPRSFTCDFTDIDVKDDEIALQVANAFSGRDRGVQLKVQKGKLYAGRVFVMWVPKSQKVARFYIPMRMNSNETFMACFTPVNPTIPCSFCTDKHRRGESCEHSRPVHLPFERIQPG